jgi:hypothetical protein
MSIAIHDPAPASANELVSAGALPGWQLDELPGPPGWRRRSWVAVLGPGLLLAGSAIGAGEWLFGPAVTAQYGGTLLWLATISIVVQVFYNLEVMRYTLYCGEPVFIGFFRTWPGPRFWTICYMVLFLAHIWPFMASNAAVPLAAALVGHLPSERVLELPGLELSESMLVKMLGFVVFYAAFVPLIFGGKVYTMLERVMAIKVIVVLLFLAVVTVTLVSWSNIAEIAIGFLRFGAVPLRAHSVVAGRHFSVARRQGDTIYQVQGTMENQSPSISSLVVKAGGKERRYDDLRRLPPALAEQRAALARRAASLARPGNFYLETFDQQGSLAIEGEIVAGQSWRPALVTLRRGAAETSYRDLSELPAAVRRRASQLLANQGFEREPIWTYWARHRRLPELDWAMLAAFAAIAGAGGLSNALLSNYARDKGWGMGARTGAIPSAIGGLTISLSHAGKVFRIDSESLARWRGWYRHIVRDQVCVWMVCSFVGLALPCMLSLEFIRNAPVSGNRVAAMTAEGISSHFPAAARFWWAATLVVSFLVLAPNAMISCDLFARLWTDLLWVGNPRVRQMKEHAVKYVYYAILAIFALWGTVALALLNPLEIAKLGAVLGNIALGFTAFHTLYVNRTLLPHGLRPNLLMQAGLVSSGAFFFVITALAALDR